MTIKVKCPGCGKSLKAPDAAAGKRAKCPQCGNVVVLPEAALDQLEVIDPILDPEVVDDAPAALPEQGPSPLDEMLAQVPPPPPPAPPGGYDLASPPEPVSGPAGGMEQRRPCPMCGELIPTHALKCRFCGEIFDPTLKKAQRKAAKRGSDGDDMAGGDWVVAILCSGIGCIAGIIWMIQGKPKGTKMVIVSGVAVAFWNIVFGVMHALAHQP